MKMARNTRFTPAFDVNGQSYAARYEMPHVELGEGGVVHLLWKSRMAGAEAMEKCCQDEWKLTILGTKIRTRNTLTEEKFTRQGGKRMLRFTMSRADADIFLEKWTEEHEGSVSEATQDE